MVGVERRANRPCELENLPDQEEENGDWCQIDEDRIHPTGSIGNEDRKMNHVNQRKRI